MNRNNIFPNNWKEIIQGKKVIFYNTSIGNLLQGREKHIEKMKWVFQIFQEHHEVVLWWRPHPLEYDTIKSMLPELEQAYTEIKQWYKDEHVGILDESTDLNRTIAVSDAYYGDWSSVIQLYKVTRKPILLSDDCLMEYSSEVAFFVCDFAIVDDYMWFISSFYSGLFKMNLSSFVVEEVIPIPGERIFEEGMMRLIIQVGRELFLIPDWGNSVISYDIDNRTMRKAVIGIRTTFSKCSNAYYRNGSLHLVSPQKRSQIKINIKNFNVESEYMEAVETLEAVQADAIYTVAKTVNEKTYAFPRIENTIQITDLKTGQNIIKKIDIVSELKEMLSTRRLFDVYQTVDPIIANPIYAGEHKWVHTLPRYIDAVANEENESNNSACIGLCGKKIYDSVQE